MKTKDHILLLFVVMALVTIVMVGLYPLPVLATPLMQSTFPSRAIVTVSLANLRSGPGTETLVAGSATAGERLQIIACNSDCSWYQIQGGLWISSTIVETENLSEVSTLDSEIAISQPTARFDANLRAGPGTHYPVVGTVRLGQPFTIVSANNDLSWYQLGAEQWIAAFLVDNAPTNLPDAVVPQLSVPPSSTNEHESPTLEAMAKLYIRIAQANVRTIGNQKAVVPGPIYANGIYARDAFFTVVGLGDLQLSEDSYRWFERAQNLETGQITTAISLDPADRSLQPQDDETTLLFLIWSGLMQREGRPIEPQLVRKAWTFVENHTQDGLYVSAPGEFRYWADCWRLDQPDTISYNQGLYALATRFLADARMAGVTPAVAAQAADGYRALFRNDVGFLPLSAKEPGNSLQDVSALLPEFLHRYFFGIGILPDTAVLSTVNHHLETAVINAADGSIAGIKNIANANGTFAATSNFACPTLNTQGDYHNGGYWPMYTLVDLAMAYQIDPQPLYRSTMETLIAKELADGTTKEYWPLAPGRVGNIEQGRSDYSWNVLIVPALRWSGLVP